MRSICKSHGLLRYARNDLELICPIFKCSRYIDYGDTQMSNCLTENQIRPFALGRKNWLFMGNQTSANRSAIWYSLIQSCLINKIDPRQYLITVLNLSPQIRRKQIEPTTLLPQFINVLLLQSH